MGELAAEAAPSPREGGLARGNLSSGTGHQSAARNAALSEILGFYGLGYGYTWQVTVLGLGPVWQSANPVARATRHSFSPTGT